MFISSFEEILDVSTHFVYVRLCIIFITLVFDDMIWKQPHCLLIFNSRTLVSNNQFVLCILENPQRAKFGFYFFFDCDEILPVSFLCLQIANIEIHPVLLIQLYDVSLLGLLYQKQLFVNSIDSAMLRLIQICHSCVDNVELLL